jgi:ferritin-like metal-binding protein YciE
MAPRTMAELYTKELKDLYSAEQQILKALPKMIDAASHDALKDALENHRRQTEKHVERLEQIFRELDESPKGEKAHGIQGIIDDGSALIKDDLAPAVLDAGLISAAQHVEHYEMAGYGSVRTWAEQLGRDAQAKLLQATLDEEKEANRVLTEIATHHVNRDATPDREVGLPGPSGELADQPPRRASSSILDTPWPPSTSTRNPPRSS